jgi:hypothetical protein
MIIFFTRLGASWMQTLAVVVNDKRRLAKALDK